MKLSVNEARSMSNRFEIFIVNYNSTPEININLSQIFRQNMDVSNLSVNIIDNSNNFILNNEFSQKPVSVFSRNNNIEENLYGKGSLDHASSLNYFVNKKVQYERFTVVLDPDCYVSGENWLENLCRYVAKKGTCVATPWHPKHEAKLRNSIAPHFVMFKHDFDQYYDFTPNFNTVSKLRSKASLAKLDVSPGLVRRILRFSKRIMFWESALDTGYKLKKNFGLIYWFRPIVYEGQVFWINSSGRPKLIYATFLKLFRGISLKDIEYEYFEHFSNRSECFEFSGVSLVHDRRTVSKK